MFMVVWLIVVGSRWYSFCPKACQVVNIKYAAVKAVNTLWGINILAKLKADIWKPNIIQYNIAVSTLYINIYNFDKTLDKWSDELFNGPNIEYQTVCGNKL